MIKLTYIQTIVERSAEAIGTEFGLRISPKVSQPHPGVISITLLITKGDDSGPQVPFDMLLASDSFQKPVAEITIFLEDRLKILAQRYLRRVGSI